MPSVLADFTGRFSVAGSDRDGPVEGRILLGEEQLILAASETDRQTIPLTEVFDVASGNEAALIDPMAGTPLTVAYRNGSSRTTAVVAGEEATIEKFTTVLFKALLNGTAVQVKHPAKVGGRVLETAFAGGLLSLRSGGVVFDTEDGPITVPLSSIVDFDRREESVGGHRRPVVAVAHVDSGQALTTVAATETSRELSLLGRYLRRTYEDVLASLRDLSLSERETETLAALYSTGDADVSLSSVVDADARTVKRILHALHEKELVESGEHNPILTAKGQIVVNQYLERVNE
ncbi:CheF family chemotaxis protein [Halapricum desulfuricans]|uniref:Component of chemotaxis system associated with archaellum, contains CheF-like and HTH domain n=1 Tax=Halapricum desulfuricans TaxID=2841257 RepID=A0A897NCH6_9EURY|nr:CheF family chemotaxis protein [Halapricum desulfuricans]QSG10178.1 Component of chemotaxis system associated with archaellum, contains CheF-like and HTH domain [Halapricum desulfuricans]